jgi:hypothetical protein
MALVLTLLLLLAHAPRAAAVPVNPGDLLVADAGLGGVIRVPQRPSVL